MYLVQLWFASKDIREIKIFIECSLGNKYCETFFQINNNNNNNSKKREWIEIVERRTFILVSASEGRLVDKLKFFYEKF